MKVSKFIIVSLIHETIAQIFNCDFFVCRVLQPRRGRIFCWLWCSPALYICLARRMVTSSVHEEDMEDPPQVVVLFKTMERTRVISFFFTKQ